MALPAFAAEAISGWSAYYEAHRAVSVTVRWLHLGGLLVGGGSALAADRRVLRALRAGPGEREASLDFLEGSHRVVVPAMAVVVLTGLLMTASDTATFLGSRLYWAKMSLVVLLLLNGTALLATERAVRHGRARGWARLTVVSAVSLVLWLVILYFGVWLTAAA
jgi:hypothetical protein